MSCLFAMCCAKLPVHVAQLLQILQEKPSNVIFPIAKFVPCKRNASIAPFNQNHALCCNVFLTCLSSTSNTWFHAMIMLLLCCMSFSQNIPLLQNVLMARHVIKLIEIQIYDILCMYVTGMQTGTDTMQIRLYSFSRFGSATCPEKEKVLNLFSFERETSL